MNRTRDTNAKKCISCKLFYGNPYCTQCNPDPRISNKCTKCCEFMGYPYCMKCHPDTIQKIDELSKLSVVDSITQFDMMEKNSRNSRNTYIQKQVVENKIVTFFKFCMDELFIKKYIIISDIKNADVFKTYIDPTDITNVMLLIEGCGLIYPKIFFTGRITEYLLTTYNVTCTIYFEKLQNVLAYHTIDVDACKYGGIYDCYHASPFHSKIYDSSLDYKIYFDRWCSHNVFIYFNCLSIVNAYQCVNDVCKLNFPNEPDVYFCNGCNTLHHKKCYDINEDEIQYVYVNEKRTMYLASCKMCMPQIKSAKCI